MCADVPRQLKPKVRFAKFVSRERDFSDVKKVARNVYNEPFYEVRPFQDRAQVVLKHAQQQFV